MSNQQPEHVFHIPGQGGETVQTGADPAAMEQQGQPASTAPETVAANKATSGEQGVHYNTVPTHETAAARWAYGIGHGIDTMRRAAISKYKSNNHG